MTTDIELARQHFLDGIEHFQARRLPEARSAFLSALQLVPGRPSVLANLALTEFHLKQWPEAIRLFSEVLEIEPEGAENWICLGLSHEAQGEWAPAAAALERGLGLGLQPGRPDLWLTCSQCYGRLGQADESLACLDKALAVDPELAAAWSARGGVLRELHRLDEAALCFEKALALGADPELHRFYLASVSGAQTPKLSPRQYVEALFDDYAADFQGHLVETLRYQGHKVLVQPLLQAGRIYQTALDLGCGTGLCGTLIRPIVSVIDGVDVAQEMLVQAGQRAIYRTLAHDDVAHFMAESEQSYELILAADVFGYVGELSSIFAAARRCLAPSGDFVFTVELSVSGEPVRLLPSLRYAHSEDYIRQLATANGFRVRSLFSETLRYDQTEPIAALYVYLEAVGG